MGTASVGSVAFWHVLPYWPSRILQACLVLGLQSAISPRSLVPFTEKWYLGVRYANCYCCSVASSFSQCTKLENTHLHTHRNLPVHLFVTYRVKNWVRISAFVKSPQIFCSKKQTKMGCFLRYQISKVLYVLFVQSPLSFVSIVNISFQAVVAYLFYLDKQKILIWMKWENLVFFIVLVFVILNTSL